MAIRDTIQKLAQNDDEQRAFEDSKPRIQAERRAAITRLIDQISALLKEQPAITCRVGKENLRDDAIGAYEVPTMSVAHRDTPLFKVSATGMTLSGFVAEAQSLRHKRSLFFHWRQSSTDPHGGAWSIRVEAPPIPQVRAGPMIARPAQRQGPSFVPATPDELEKAIDALISP